ncbi:MAG: heme biosynthesis HemY N-terminal domain-containing protein [Tateyamaria sp.]|uniref:heme biosynthesis protein HemY n=1 Tax=Tateyamaria sp. TaxID=1929288 RepID=UPI00329CCAC1
MIWSLVKIIIFVVAVAALALGAGWLLEAEGGIRIIVGGVERTLDPLLSVIALILLVLAIWIGLKVLGLLVAFWKFLNGDETAISRYFARNKASKGFDALAEGMMALASGEGRLALAKAEKADKYLNRPELTNLLTAQAAELAGDHKKAEETYRKLVQNDATRFVGVRGILKQKLADGDTDTALQLAQKAFALKPKHEDTQDVLLQLQADNEDWSGARQTLSAKLKHGHMPRDLHKRRDAVLALSEAKKIFEADQTIEARETAIAANKQSPDLIPAAVMAAHSYIDQGQKKYAVRVLKKAWQVQPHPDLAAAYAAIEPDETPAERLKRFAQLTRTQPNDPESRMLMSELNIAAEDFPAARRALGDLFETDPTTRSAALMAAIERGQGASDAVVQGWLARALSAPRGPQWVCDNCQNIQAEWTPTCTNCASFDTLSWKRPPSVDLAMPGGTEMLPLLGAKPNDEPEDVVVVVEEPTADVIEAETLDSPSK